MRIDSVCTGRVSSYGKIDTRRTFADNILEADEAYVIGKRGQYTPVAAYLAGDEIIKIALAHGVNMIHPGESKFCRLGTAG